VSIRERVLGVARFAPSLRERAAPLDVEDVPALVLNSPHAIVVTIDVPANGVQGVLVSHGSRDGGYVLFVQDNHVHYVHNYLGVIEVHAVSTAPLPTGPVHIRFEFAPMETKRFGISRGTPGRATLFFDDRLVGEKELPVTLPFGLAIGGGVCVGRDSGHGVSRMYDAPFEFTGALLSVSYRFGRELATFTPDEATEICIHPS
jgi:hypothetical protein